VRFATQKYFEDDWGRLKPEHQRQFRAVLKDKFIPACDQWVMAQESGTRYVWPKSLRVSPLVNAGGIMEMTWSFASPDGRATFHFAHDAGHWTCFWRRIGDHGVFRTP